VFSERHLRHLLLSYMKYYNGARTIYPWRRMHRSRSPSIAPGKFFVAHSWAGCITNIPGFNLRQAQVWDQPWAPIGGGQRPRRFTTSAAIWLHHAIYVESAAPSGMLARCKVKAQTRWYRASGYFKAQSVCQFRSTSSPVF
jgi:hypothetical protein